MKVFKENTSEAYKVQVDCFKIQSLIAMIKMIRKKVNDFVRFHEATQEKLKKASYSEQIQVLTVVPDK